MEPSGTPLRHHPGLHTLRTKLQDILKSISSFGPTVPRPPIIDSSFDLAGNPVEDSQRQDAVRGLRALKDSVKRDLDVLENFLAKPDCDRLPALSTNAPYLVSVWNEVLLAPSPVTAIWNTYSETGKALYPRRRGLPKEAGVKVDVVADGGRRWIRVNTTKNSRLLAEFREIDSYFTDSEEESDAEDTLPSLAQTEFDNSILRTGRSLLAAARENPIPGTNEVPAVTLRLTRLELSPSNEMEHDPRIAQTIEELRVLGIDVQLGEREDAALLQPSNGVPARLWRQIPTTRINLDLSILIALVSDLTHTTLPVSPQDANIRFTPSTQYVEWKNKRIALLNSGSVQNTQADEDRLDAADRDSVGRPSRALVHQVQQEMGKALFQDIFDRLSPVLCSVPELLVSQPPSTAFPSVEFWTTPEAKERCLQIVAKIGGPKERSRADALFCVADVIEAEQLYWRDSRYPLGFIPLLPIRIFPTDDPEQNLRAPSFTEDGMSLSPFFQALASTCRDVLVQETIPHPRSARALPIATPKDDDDPGEIQRANVTKANPRLTAHTVQSMLWGAAKGWTTLTANKTSVKAILREMKAARNGSLWNRGDESDRVPPSTNAVLGLANGTALVRDDFEVAAIWQVDPRSLAEGMRSDCEDP